MCIRDSPQSGEDVALHAEARRLQAVDDLRAAARSALVALAGDDDSGDHPTALGLVSTARKSLAGIADADADIAPLVDRIAEAGYALADVAADLSSYLAGLDADPARLEWIASRLAALQGLSLIHI